MRAREIARRNLPGIIPGKFRSRESRNHDPAGAATGVGDGEIRVAGADDIIFGASFSCGGDGGVGRWSTVAIHNDGAQVSGK